MTVFPVMPALAAVLCLGALVGCVSGGSGNASKYATACMAEVNPVGGMVWRDGDDRVMGDNFATREGIEAMNACIDRKAAAAGGASPAQSTAVPSGAMVTEASPAAGATVAGATGQECRRRNVMSGGSGYFGCLR